MAVKTETTEYKTPKGKGQALRRMCSLPPSRERQFSTVLDPRRLSLLQSLDRKWVNGTVLHYAFFDGHPVWDAAENQKDVVRQAFETWKDVGIGLDFEEVANLADAEIRIGFQQDGLSWSALGRDILNEGQNDRTMNLGWNIDVPGPNGLDTAIHEIGHTLGFPHEHQNPNAGIVWNEQAVYDAFAAPPNEWPPEQTHWNVLRKLSTQAFRGSDWDKDSIMHYSFPPGLILQPATFLQTGLDPAPGLSTFDQEEVRRFYPPLLPTDYLELNPLELQRVNIQPGQQLNFVIKPAVSREYNIRTFGLSDTVMVLFEGVQNPRFLAGDDDSGTDLNAHISMRLFRDRAYLLRLRLYWQQDAGSTVMLMW